MTADALLRTITERCGPAAVLAPEDTAQRSTLLAGIAFPAVPLLRPASTAELSFMLRQCHAASRALIPVGGTTGLVKGVLPATGQEWYLSLERMRAIERIDTASRVAVVQAGVVLQQLHDAVADQGLLFGVDLGSRGSATIGGLIGTNAGGERVLRFGMMREQVLGLEVVLADGTVLDLMDEVLKNNAGYDLKALFCGSEGTLGIVTRAVLRLRPAFASAATGFLALATLDHLPQVLQRMEQGLGGTLSAFELMWPEFIATQCDNSGSPHRRPLPAPSPEAAGYLLVESLGGDAQADAQRFESALESLLSDGLIADAALAQSETERRAFWAIRNDIPHYARYWSPRASFDISVPIASMVGYVDEFRQRITERWPEARTIVFGHVADNNLHLSVALGPATHQHYAEIAEVVYAGVTARRGSISAEHGIGLDKRDALAQHRPPEALALMRQLKAMMDPHHLLNPGKVV